MGQSLSNIHNAEDNPEEDIREDNRLYDRLLDSEEFRNECKERWIFLREEVWTEEYIMDLLSKNYNKINDVLEIDTEMWNPVKLNDKWDNDVEEFVNHLFKWFPDRLEFCDYYFNSL
jgi:hypothetical protein